MAAALAALAACSLAARAQDAEPVASPPPIVRLTYDVVVDREPSSEGETKGQPLVPHEERRVVVTLGPQLVDVAAAGEPRLHLDYASGWEHRIDDEAGTYRSTPLVAHFGFVEIEMFNRRKLGGVLEAADVPEPAFRPVEISILFGWPDPRDDADIQSAVEGHTTVWKLGDEELTRCTRSEHELDEAQRAALARFLQRECPLHWEIRESVQESARVPAVLRTRWHNVGRKETATWTLVSCERSAQAPSGIDGMKREFADTRLGRLARRVLAPGDAEPVTGSPDELVKLSRASHEAGNAEDAALLLLECTLTGGADVSPDLRKLIADPDDRQRVTVLMTAVTRGNSDPEKGLAELDAIDRSQLTHPALIDVFRANALSNVGKKEDAVKTFLDALEELPALAAAYADLGWVHHERFRTRDAWLAWEIGRALAPEHPTWQAVQGLEQHLEDTFGELL
jgi:hypothetical protein